MSSRLGGEGDAESSRETSSGGSSDCEVERRSISSSDGMRNQHSLVNLNAQRLNRLSLSDKAVMGSLSDESEISKSLGQLIFEYLEHEQPHHRRPLVDKVHHLLVFEKNPHLYPKWVLCSAFCSSLSDSSVGISISRAEEVPEL